MAGVPSSNVLPSLIPSMGEIDLLEEDIGVGPDEALAPTQSDGEISMAYDDFGPTPAPRSNPAPSFNQPTVSPDTTYSGPPLPGEIALEAGEIKVEDTWKTWGRKAAMQVGTNLISVLPRAIELFSETISEGETILSGISGIPNAAGKIAAVPVDALGMEKAADALRLAGEVGQKVVDSMMDVSPWQMAAKTAAAAQRDLIGPDKLDVMATESKQELAIMRQMLEDNQFVADPWSVKGIAGTTVSSVGRMLLAIGGGLVGGPGVTLAMMGGDLFSQQYSDSRLKGRSVEDSLTDATAMAGFEIIGENAVLSTIMKSGLPFFKRIGMTALGESGQEAVTQALEEAYNMGVLDPNAKLSEAVQRVLYAGVVGGLSGAMIAPVGFSAQSAREAGEKRKIINAVREVEGNFLHPTDQLLEDDRLYQEFVSKNPGHHLLTPGEVGFLLQFELLDNLVTQRIEELGSDTQLLEARARIKANLELLRAKNGILIDQYGQLTLPGFGIAETISPPEINETQAKMNLNEAVKKVGNAEFDKQWEVPIPATIKEHEIAKAFLDEADQIYGKAGAELRQSIDSWSVGAYSNSLLRIREEKKNNPEYIAEVNEFLDRLFPGVDYITAYKGIKYDRTLEESYKNGVGNGSLGPAAALLWAEGRVLYVPGSGPQKTRTHVMRIPKSSVLAIGKKAYAAEMEIIFDTAPGKYIGWYETGPLASLPEQKTQLKSQTNPPVIISGTQLEPGKPVKTKQLSMFGSTKTVPEKTEPEQLELNEADFGLGLQPDLFGPAPEIQEEVTPPEYETLDLAGLANWVPEAEPVTTPPVGSNSGPMTKGLAQYFHCLWLDQLTFEPGTQAGSNPGGLAKTNYGATYYMKYTKDLAHLQNELFANTFLDTLTKGLTPQLSVVMDSNGDLVGVASLFQPGLQKLNSKAASENLIDAAPDFYHDSIIHLALLNYDFVGKDFDNAFMGGYQIYYLDQGGALKYRAMGELKIGFDAEATDPGIDWPKHIESLVNQAFKKNKQIKEAAHLFDKALQRSHLDVSIMRDFWWNKAYEKLAKGDFVQILDKFQAAGIPLSQDYHTYMAGVQQWAIKKLEQGKTPEAAVAYSLLGFGQNPMNYPKLASLGHRMSRLNQYIGNAVPFNKITGALNPGDKIYYKPGAVTVLADMDLRAYVNRVHGIEESAKTIPKLIEPAIQLAERMAKTFFPKSIVVLRFANTSNAYGSCAFVPSSVPNMEPVVIISLSARTFNYHGIVGAAETLAHEFGHAIQFRYWNDAPEYLREKVWEKFRQWQRKYDKGTFGEAAKTSLSLHQYAGFVRHDTGTMDMPLQTFSDQNYASLFGFKEWFANQVAKHAMQQVYQADAGGNNQPVGVVEKFFRKIAIALKKLYKMPYDIKGMVMADSFKPDSWVAAFIQHAMHEANTTHTFGGDFHVREGLGTRGDSSIHYQTASLVSNQISTLNQSVGSPLPPQSMRTLNFALDKFSKFIKLTWSLPQIVAKNSHIERLVAYYDEVQRWHHETVMPWISNADTVSKAWAALGPHQADAVAKLFYALTTKEYLHKGVPLRQPTNEELMTLAAKYGVDQRGMQTYLEVSAWFSDFLNAFEKSQIDNVLLTIKDPAQAAARIKEIEDDYTLMRRTPYFPLTRFGDYMLVVKDPAGNTVHVESFQTDAESTRNLKRVQNMFPGFFVREDKIEEKIAVYRYMPPGFVKQLRNELQGLTPHQEQQLDDLLADYLPEVSFHHHLQRRTEVGGWSTDGLRTFASYALHGARALGRSKHLEVLKGHVHGVGETIDRSATDVPNVRKRVMIKEMLNQHLDYIMNPPEEYSKIRAIAFTWHLGFNVKSAAVNLTQTPFVTLPYLGSLFGNRAAAEEISWAMADVKALYNAVNYKPDPRLLNAINLGIRQGFLTESQAMELAGMANGGMLQKLAPGNVLSRRVNDMAFAAAWMFQQAEKTNRRIAFRAGWKLAIAQPQNAFVLETIRLNQRRYYELQSDYGMTPEEAAAFMVAKRAVLATQFEYSSYARPELMRGWRAPVLMFYQFTFNMLWNFRYSPGGAKMLLVYLLMGGLMGLPFMENINDLVQFIARKLGMELDPEYEVRKVLTDLGSEHPDVWLNGISRYGMGLGFIGNMLGLPIPSVDLSGSFSFGNVVPGLSAVGSPGDFEDKFYQAGTDIVGAAFGVGMTMLKAANSDNPDEFKQWERAMPSAIRGMMKARRWVDQGAEKDRNGVAVVNFNTTDTEQVLEIMAQALSFPITRVTQKWDELSVQNERILFYKLERTTLLQSLNHARANHDQEAQARARKAIRDFNSSVPNGKLKLNGMTIAKSWQSYLQRRRVGTQGMPQEWAYRPLARETREEYPEVFKEKL